MAGMEPPPQLPPEAPPEAGRTGRRNWSGLLRGLVLPLAVLALIVGGLWYWDNRGGGSTKDSFGTVALPTAKNATGQSAAPKVGRAAPDFLLEMPQGGLLRLSDLQGKPVLINFWATWCPPCRSEMPELVKAYDQHQQDGLVVVGIDLQEPDDMVLKFAQDFGVRFPLAIDRDGDVADAWKIGGPIQGLPTSYFIDKTGVIRYIALGPLTADLLAQHLGVILPAVTS